MSLEKCRQKAHDLKENILQVGNIDLHGKYQCRAKNQLGEAMALTEVSGKPAPANFKSPKVRIILLLKSSLSIPRDFLSCLS